MINKLKTLLRLRSKRELIPIVTSLETAKLFEGKVAFIAGGNSGIGFSIAQRLISGGCKVIIGGSNSEKTQNACKKLNSSYAHPINVDYSKPELFETVINEIITEYGGLDIFVNSTGVHSINMDFWNMTLEEFERVININLKGAYFMAQTISKYMVENSVHGHILFISSSRGSEPAWSPYGISKWGLNGFNQGLAQMLAAKKITVNCIAPGPTATGLIGFNEGDSIYSVDTACGSLCMPEEVASLAILLLSDAGRMVTGETIHISGGRGVWDLR